MHDRQFTSYALVGSGRVAKQLQFYLKSLRLPFVTWSRQAGAETLERVVASSSHVLFAVKDDAIAELAFPWLESHKTLVHFSGAAQIPGVHVAHPLMTFGPNLEPLAWYKQIPFVIDEGDQFANLLPGLPNFSWTLPEHQRPLYHALVSLAGNSSYLLWQKIGAEFERMGLPRSLLSPFLHQVVENAAQNLPGGFTGPVARGDWKTVAKHTAALTQTDLGESYKDFLALAQRTGLPVPQEIL